MVLKNKKKIKKRTWKLGRGMILLVVLLGITLSVSGCDSGSDSKVKPDTKMKTHVYNTDITLLPSAGIRVREHIDVSFSPKRHGIYRYIRNEGVMKYRENGKLKQYPYTGQINVLKSNVTYDSDTDGDFKVLKFGDEDTTISKQVYDFTYEQVPTFDTKDIHVAYINLFPSRWQNPIPSGSRFTIHFPKGYDQKKLKFYYGEYGSTKDGTKILNLKYEKNQVTGTLKKSLPLGSGITAFENMGTGYFTKIDTDEYAKRFVVNTAIFAVVLSIVLFLIFGIGRKPITSIQYAAPQGQDSSTVGYIVDGTVDPKDLLSLILFWADMGCVTLEEAKDDNLLMKMKKPLPADAPKHQVRLFEGFFGKSKKKSSGVKLNKLGTGFQASAKEAATDIYEMFSEKGKKIYSGISKYPRWVAVGITACATVFCFVNVLLACGSSMISMVLIFCEMIMAFYGMYMVLDVMKNWDSTGSAQRKKKLIYACLVIIISYGALFMTNKAMVWMHKGMDYTVMILPVLIGTLAGTIIAGAIRRRSEYGTELMGWILGIRDFIETAELTRINAMADEHPDWFYHLLPYAYVFGLTDTWVKRLDQLGLTISTPSWYITSGRDQDMFRYMAFLNRFDSATANISEAIDAAIASEEEKSSSVDSDSSDGGFSGGGFGGGGGGSW